MIGKNKEMSMSELLFDCEAFRKLRKPVLVTSGDFFTPFFCNTENLCGDREIESFLQRKGDDPDEVIDYVTRLSQTNSCFKQVMMQLTEKAADVIRRWETGEQPAISGGQRRDWLFSGPVAMNLGLPHISIFKPKEDSVPQKYFCSKAGTGGTENQDLTGYRVLHIADLITRGSSIYDTDGASGAETGWVPTLRRSGAVVEDLLSVISRNQGGEQMLAARGVTAESLITVDAAFIAECVSNPQPLLAFLENPKEWTEAYLRKQGPEVLFDYCRADDKKQPRLRKFVRKYRRFLQQQGWLEIIEEKLISPGNKSGIGAGSHEAA